MKVIALAVVLAALSPAARAEEKFQEQVEDVLKTDWRKELLERLARERAERPDLAPPVLSTAPDEGRVLLRFSFEDKDKSWRDSVSMSMTLKTFERYRRIDQNYEDAVAVFGRDRVDPSRYFSFGGRDAAAVADVLFTGLENDPFVQAHPWLDGPISWLAEGMRQFDRFDRGSAWDVFGFEVDDWVSDKFGVGAARDRPGRSEAIGLGMTGPVSGSPDGGFHGRLRFRINGLERAATRFDADPIRFKVKYEIRCPKSFVLDRVEVGGEARPFCRDERSNLRIYVGGAKSF